MPTPEEVEPILPEMVLVEAGSFQMGSTNGAPNERAPLVMPFCGFFALAVSGCGPDSSLGDTWTRPADGMVMVYVPGGQFEMGSDNDDLDYMMQLCKEYYGDCFRGWFKNEQPVHTVVLDGFWIDRTEVTNAQYRQCTEAGECDPPAESSSPTGDLYYGNSTYDNYLVVYVSWHQAADYCEWADARLPTEAEWEYAARGPEGRVFSWEDTFDGTRVNYCDANCKFGWADESVDDGYSYTAPVGSYPDGVSWCGALDLAGNVWEWVSDRYQEDYYQTASDRNPEGPDKGTGQVMRGGSWSEAPINVRCAYRSWYMPDARYFNLGFRCARDPG